jgi:formylglycine-generating enzyme required for sulfatase activity
VLPFDDRVEWRVLAVAENGVGVWSAPGVFWTVPERFVVYEGYFFMGDEAAVHPGNPIWADSYSIDRFEVTNDQFARILNRLLATGTVSYEAGEILEVGTEHVVGQVCGEPAGCPSLDLRYEDGRIVVAASRGNHPITNVTWYGANLVSFR